MKCTEVKENLDACLDGEIGRTQAASIGTHLEHCAVCRSEFENLQTVGSSVKRILPVTTNAAFDERMLAAFRTFHAPKRSVKEKPTRSGWFNIPRFAFAAAFLLLAMFSALAFQIGRLSAATVVLSPPADDAGRTVTIPAENNKFTQKEPEIIEVPVIKERIVEVPVIRERIVTRTVYVEKDTENPPGDQPEETFALKNSVRDGEFLTQTNLEGFQPVAEIKVRITKKEEE
jgi:anti-sigma factor RsiW